MARRQAVAVENNFIRGLITENTALNFPENAAKETRNCNFDHLGRITRRPGLDIEAMLGTENRTFVETEVYTEHLWQGVSGDGSITFQVQQIGSVLKFYDVSDTLETTSNKFTFEVDLTDFLVGTDNPGEYQCQYANGNGDLIVVNPVCNPFYVYYDLEANDFDTEEIIVEERDFRGVDSVAPIGGSVTNVTPATGSLVWTLVNYVPFTVGEEITIYDLTSSGLADYMVGTITDYAVGTKVLTVNVTSVSGSTAASSSWGFVPNSRAINDFDRPYTDLTTLATYFTSHYYNLLNQGWWLQILDATNGPLNQWDTARTDLPSNNDTVGLYRASETDAFDNTRVSSRAPGNTPAAKGHFILDVGNYIRIAAMNEQLGVGDASTTVTTVTTSDVEQTLLSVPTISGGEITQTFVSGPHENLSDSNLNWSNGSAAFDTTTTQAISNCALIDNTVTRATSVIVSSPAVSTLRYRVGLGKNFGSANKKKIKQVIVYPSTSGWYVESTGQEGSSFSNVDIYIRASNTAPTDTTFDSAGTLLGTITGRGRASTSSATFTVTNTSTWQYVWAYITFTHNMTVDYDGSTAEQRIRVGVAEIRIWAEETTTTTTTIDTALGALINETTNNRFSTTAFFAGRVWYGGLNWQHLSNTVFFSQIIEKRNQYGRCYQQNDPTHESLFDLLSSDGGSVKIPEMGKLVKMFVYQNSLLLFASNGVWRITGGGGFSATDYSVRKLSSLGTSSPMSFVDYEGIPVWWGDNSINTLIYNPDFDSFQVVSLSDETIKSFIQDIPVANRKLIKGAYDRENKRVMWLFKTTEDPDCYCYDAVLVFNGITKAFYPWYSTSTNIELRGILHLTDPKATAASKIKYTVTDDNGDGTHELFFGEANGTSWQDWSVYSASVSLDAADEVDYQSYFITGYKLDGQTQRFFQPNYVFVFLEQEDDSSCYMQSIYDFTTSGNSGKWGTKQQVYNSTLTNRDVNFKRLKVRGKGRACQLRFNSETGKPFTIIGWSVYETTNEGI